MFVHVARQAALLRHGVRGWRGRGPAMTNLVGGMGLLSSSFDVPRAETPSRFPLQGGDANRCRRYASERRRAGAALCCQWNDQGSAPAAGERTTETRRRALAPHLL